MLIALMIHFISTNIALAVILLSAVLVPVGDISTQLPTEIVASNVFISATLKECALFKFFLNETETVKQNLRLMKLNQFLQQSKNLLFQGNQTELARKFQ